MSTDSSDDDVNVAAEYEADEDQLERNPGGHGKWVSGLVALVGVWVLAAPFLLAVETAAHLWTDVVVGLLLIALGGYNYYRRRDERLASVGVATFVALLGLWMIVAPFVLGGEFIRVGFEGFADADPMFWSDVLGGLVVLGLGAYSAYEARDTDHTSPAEA